MTRTLPTAPVHPWAWTYDDFDSAQEGVRESLCTLGNGYMATRGALPEMDADEVHYPATYIAGVFNRLSAQVAGHEVENESLVNTPNWLVLRYRTPDGQRFDPEAADLLDHSVELDLRRGVLHRRSRFRDAVGRILAVSQRRFVSIRDPHLCGMETTLVAENWSGPLEIVTGVDGTVRNTGVDRYRDLGTDHLVGVESRQPCDDTVSLEVETSDSKVRIAVAARTRVTSLAQPSKVDRHTSLGHRMVEQRMTVRLDEGQEVIVEKIAATFTSRDVGTYEPLGEAEDWASNVAGPFGELLERHIVSWRHVWDRAEIALDADETDTARVLNLHVFHLLQTTSKNITDLDVGVPARGLHGEAYRGHIFWDEVFIFPFLNWRAPELSRALLRYRSRRLDRARRSATAAGFRGAMYPWQSASSGREETQTFHLNPKSGRWLPDPSHLQRHINGGVAYNVWNYWQVTADIEFMRFWGAEMMLEIARFWSSAATYNRTLDRYEIKGVMGPDEFHEAYPDADQPGLDNNAYTNVLAVWCLLRGFDALEVVPVPRSQQLREKLGLDAEELDRWADISRKMRLCFHDDGILSQFEGYEELKELDWVDYRERYGNIQRLDRILEAEGDTPNRYKVAKQADTLMLHYLFSETELSELIVRLGYEYPPDSLRKNLEYYESRTSHGSTLSQTVAAWLFSRIDRERSWSLFRDALLGDVSDSQGGTTAEGIHLGAMAGTVDLVQRCYTGIETRQEVLRLDPALPDELEGLSFDTGYRGHTIHLDFSHGHVKVSVADNGVTSRPIAIDIRGTVAEVGPGDMLEVALD